MYVVLGYLFDLHTLVAELMPRLRFQKIPNKTLNTTLLTLTRKSQVPPSVIQQSNKCCSNGVSFCKRDSSLNPKITGIPWACFLSRVVSGLPLYPAVFRLGVMSLLGGQLLHYSFTAQLRFSCSCQLIVFSWKLKNIDHKNTTCSSEKELSKDERQWILFHLLYLTECLTHGGNSEVIRLCLALLSSCSKKARARLSRLFFPARFLLQQKKRTSPINSQLKLNSKYPNA